MLSVDNVAYACHAPLENVSVAWPLIVAALEAEGIVSKNAIIAAAATVAVETGVSLHGKNQTFLPIHELGSDAYLNRAYDARIDLGNTPGLDGDGALYAGRGFIQLTGKDNYEKAGSYIGVDLVEDPDAALDPENAARIFAWFFKIHHIQHIADTGNFIQVRRCVNGGRNGLESFLNYVKELSTYWED